jgi:hypothetical protein
MKDRSVSPLRPAQGMVASIRLARQRHRLGFCTFLAVAIFLLVGAPHGLTQSLTDCPGVVVSQIPTPSLNFFGSLINRVYVADPCILVLSDGDYLASHALFARLKAVMP